MAAVAATTDIIDIERRPFRTALYVYDMLQSEDLAFQFITQKPKAAEEALWIKGKIEGKKELQGTLFYKSLCSSFMRNGAGM